jgi:enamine deaminase RidA (YjgF/YER057c/UK114 family)
MSHSTQLNVTTIDQQAARHDSTAENISQQLNQLKAHVEATLAASGSAATRALSTTCDNWVESVRKSVLQHLSAMADNMRREAKNQEGTDQTSTQAILNVPMETGNFLGVHA